MEHTVQIWISGESFIWGLIKLTLDASILIFWGILVHLRFSRKLNFRKASFKVILFFSCYSSSSAAAAAVVAAVVIVAVVVVVEGGGGAGGG